MVPRLDLGAGPAPSACTTPRRVRCRRIDAVRRRADVRLRHHAVRRHAHRPRRDLRRLRPAQPRLARRRPRGRTTCRTSPTSTTRCSSARPRPASTGRSSPSGRPSCSASDMDGAAGAPARRLRRRGRVDPGHRRARSSGCRTAVHVYDVDGDLYFDVSSDPRFGEVSGLDEAEMLEAVRRARRRPRPAGQEAPARRPAVAGRAAGRAGLGLAARARPARLARRVLGDRAAATSASSSTCRAAAATWSSRTTR